MYIAIEYKILALAAVTFSTYICAFIPKVLKLDSRGKESVFISIILCFGAGVLLATSVALILPDIREHIEKWGEILLFIGFFSTYLINVIISYFHPKKKPSSDEQDSLLPEDSHRNYGSIDNESESESESENIISTNRNSSEQSDDQELSLNFDLTIAVITQALLEGLYIAVECSINGSLLMLYALCTHKLFVAFWLGETLFKYEQPWPVLIHILSVFALTSDLGIVFGLLFRMGMSPEMKTFITYIEGIAGGALLYIALCAIVSHEKARKLPKYAGIFQNIGMFFGFAVAADMAILF